MSDKLLNNKVLIEKKIYTSNIMSARKIQVDEFIKKYEDFTNKKALRGGKFTKAFKDFNKDELMMGDTRIVAFDNNTLYDVINNKFLKKHVYKTDKNKIRKKYDNSLTSIKDDVIILSNPYIEKIATRVRKAEMNKKNIDIVLNHQYLNNKMSNLLKVLNPTTTRYLFTTTDENGGKVIYTLNSANIEKLKKYMDSDVLYEETSWESGMAVVSAFYEKRPFTLTVLGEPAKYQINEGAFFGFNHLMDKVNLKRYGIYTPVEEIIDDGKYDINCICESLQNAGVDITSIKHLVKNRSIPQKDLGVVANACGVYLTLKYIKDEKKKLHFGDKSLPEIKIGNINSHYFLIEPTEYTRYSIENYFNICDLNDFNKMINDKHHKKTNRFIDSYNLIKILMLNQEKYLTPIHYHHNLYKSTFYNDVEEFGSLEYHEDDNTQENPESKIGKESSSIILDNIFYDFETTTRREDDEKTIHKPYCVYTDRHRNGFWGDDCGRLLLNHLCDQYGTEKTEENKDTLTKIMKHKYSLRLIAHNAGYDFRFIIKYLYGIETIEKMNGLMSGNAFVYHGNKILSINLRDSLKMINMGLGKFGSCFSLEVKKEILPYDLYSEENVSEKYIDKDICLNFVKENDKLEYIENCTKWDCMVNMDGKFKIDIHKYAGEYCYMDCITLRDGYNKFAGLVKEATNQNIGDYISLASMANDYLLGEGCYDGVEMLSGVPRHFIQKCVVGGRTMTAENKMWRKSDCNISDFDAVSLYPSAMNRMDGFLKGTPHVIENFEPEKYDGYFIQIEITKIGKEYKFPCASLITDEGIRNFTNDLVGKKIYMDKTGLEDLIHFQQAEYKFIKGYYYDEGRNENIKDTMKHLFLERIKYKKVKNPIQMVFKELMNSSYGKSFMKPIDTDTEYISRFSYNKETKEKDENGLMKYVDRHYNSVKEITLMADDKTYKCKKIKPIDEHFNNVHVGVEILSMSKRIMYEVMTLAEDNNMKMYITDTDSIHIDTECVEPLGKLFREKYGRELIGSGMGQFHTDFDMNKSCGEITAVDSVFLGKKCYCDKLKSVDKNGTDIYDYHVRMKGIPNDCIIDKANKEFNGDIIALYNYLYENPEGLEFNLLACRPKFEFHKNMTISSKQKFNRRIKFKQKIN